MIQIEDYNFHKNYLRSFQAEIYEQGYLRGDKEWNYPCITSPYHRIYLPVSGMCRVSWDIDGEGNELILKPGYVCLIPANHCFSYSTDGRFEKWYFHFNALLYGVSDIFSHLKTPLEMTAGECLTRQASELGNSRKSGRGAASLSLQLGIRNMFYSLIEGFVTRDDVNLDQISLLSMEKIPLLGIYEFIRANRSVVLPAEELAERLGRSLSSLNGHFKKHSGLTIKGYNEQYICDLARKELLFSSRTLQAIAFGLGFRDYYYFSRFFKKHTGLSPRHYRKTGITYSKL